MSVTKISSAKSIASKFFFTITTSFFFFHFILSAREPAVLPVRSLSIDQYKKVEDPENVKRFDFSLKSRLFSGPLSHERFYTIVSITSLIFLTLTLITWCWWRIWKKSMRQELRPDNVFRFTPRSKLSNSEKAEESTSDDDDFQLPKAS